MGKSVVARAIIGEVCMPPSHTESTRSPLGGPRTVETLTVYAHQLGVMDIRMSNTIMNRLPKID